MDRFKDVVLFLATAAAGLLIWLTIAALGGRREAWDSPYFSSIGFPCMALVSGLAGFLRPGRPWLWGGGTVVLQPVALYWGGKLGPFGPIGLIFFVFYALVLWVCAVGGASLRRSVSGGRNTARRS